MKAKKEIRVVQAKKDLKHLGGSDDDDWNRGLADQAIQTLWIKHSDSKRKSLQ
jgi:hypothetical protein